ncbi:hypothetical protein M758_6G107300 [Ceratodon purpureus]|nr:hypothetical protein M758_6G107300 [Ceratodon purpureus]
MTSSRGSWSREMQRDVRRLEEASGITFASFLENKVVSPLAMPGACAANPIVLADPEATGAATTTTAPKRMPSRPIRRRVPCRLLLSPSGCRSNVATSLPDAPAVVVCDLNLPEQVIKSDENEGIVKQPPELHVDGEASRAAPENGGDLLRDEVERSESLLLLAVPASSDPSLNSTAAYPACLHLEPAIALGSDADFIPPTSEGFGPHATLADLQISPSAADSCEFPSSAKN